MYKNPMLQHNRIVNVELYTANIADLPETDNRKNVTKKNLNKTGIIIQISKQWTLYTLCEAPKQVNMSCIHFLKFFFLE